jgi:hypothetical protein
MTTSIVKSYAHNQNVASSTWTINHNLGAEPAVDVFLVVNGQAQKAFPMSVTHPSENSTVITWSISRTGIAILVS